jgi:hypothetical protein
MDNQRSCSGIEGREDVDYASLDHIGGFDGTGFHSGRRRVGINPANLMFGGVPAVGIAGAVIARFQSQGMIRALATTALAQALVAAVALIAGWGSIGPTWPWNIALLTGFFAALWLVSAWLFRKAQLDQALEEAA